MNRDQLLHQKAARAVEMREAGATYKEIAAALGIGFATAHRWVNPETTEHCRAVSRTWKARNVERQAQYNHDYSQAQKVPCTYCSGRMSPGAEMCQDCHNAVAEVRQTLGEGMWADGWKCKEFTAVVGIPSNVGRAAGWDLPHRYSPERIAAQRARRWGPEPSPFHRLRDAAGVPAKASANQGTTTRCQTRILEPNLA